MKFYKFDEKLPEVGTNILVVCECKSEGSSIGICEVTLNALKVMRSIKEDVINSSLGYYPQDFFSDDCRDDGEYDLQSANYWCYPSSIKAKPKKRRKKYERASQTQAS